MCQVSWRVGEICAGVILAYRVISQGIPGIRRRRDAAEKNILRWSEEDRGGKVKVKKTLRVRRDCKRKCSLQILLYIHRAMMLQ